MIRNHAFGTDLAANSGGLQRDFGQPAARAANNNKVFGVNLMNGSHDVQVEATLHEKLREGEQVELAAFLDGEIVVDDSTHKEFQDEMSVEHVSAFEL